MRQRHAGDRSCVRMKPVRLTTWQHYLKKYAKTEGTVAFVGK